VPAHKEVGIGFGRGTDNRELSVERGVRHTGPASAVGWPLPTHGGDSTQQSGFEVHGLRSKGAPLCAARNDERDAASHIKTLLRGQQSRV
jgi:hypothetical protein